MSETCRLWIAIATLVFNTITLVSLIVAGRYQAKTRRLQEEMWRKRFTP